MSKIRERLEGKGFHWEGLAPFFGVTFVTRLAQRTSGWDDTHMTAQHKAVMPRVRNMNFSKLLYRQRAQAFHLWQAPCTVRRRRSRTNKH